MALGPSVEFEGLVQLFHLVQLVYFLFQWGLEFKPPEVGILCDRA